MTEQPADLTVVREHTPALAGFATASPALTLARGKAVADAAAPVIRELNLYKRIHQSFHVYFDGWTMVGAMVGVFPVTVRTWEIGQDEGYGANVEARTLGGQVVGAADAIVMRDEEVGGKQRWLEAPAFQVASMAQCVPLRAQILTQRGWRHAWELTTGEPVLGYDIEADACQWVPLEQVSVFDSGKPMARLTSRSFDVECTVDHSWATFPTSSAGRRRLIPTNQLKSSRKIVIAAPGPEAGAYASSISERDAAVWGWLMTDGSLSERGGQPRAHVDQCEGENAEMLRKLLAGWITSETVSYPDLAHLSPNGKPWGRRPVVRFNLSAAATRGLLARAGITERAQVPTLAASLGGPARRAMLDAMIRADGWVRPHGRFMWGKKRQDAIDTFHVLCALEGIPLGRQGRAADGFPRWAQRKDRTIHSRWLKVEPAPLQPTWCPTTPLGTWVMRLDGQVTITGNTRAGGKALRQPLGWIMRLAGYEATPAEEMDEGAAARGETVSGGKGVMAGWRDWAEQNRAHDRMNVYLDKHGVRELAGQIMDSKGYVAPLSKGQMSDLRRAVDRELEERKEEESSRPASDDAPGRPAATSAAGGDGPPATPAADQPSDPGRADRTGREAADESATTPGPDDPVGGDAVDGD